jgi:hypothetical protein
MPQINQLSAVDGLRPGDLIPVFSTGNGDARKASVGLFADYVAQANFVQPVTVANLPSPSTAGLRGFVTDANATTFHSVVAGGGANFVPVFADGTAWRIG